MLWFIEKEYPIIDRGDIDKDVIRNFFKEKEHREDMMLVYDKGEFYGCICSMTLDNAIEADEDLLICKDRYIHTPDDVNLIRQLKKIVEKTILPMIPIIIRGGGGAENSVFCI